MTDRVRDLLDALERLLRATKGRVQVKNLLETAVRGLSEDEARQYVKAAVAMLAKRHPGKKAPPRSSRK